MVGKAQAPESHVSVIDQNLLCSELARVLTLRPGASARELFWLMQQSGFQVTKHDLNSVQYSCRSLFWNDQAAPPRWQVMSGTALAPPADLRPLPGGSTYPFELDAWQAAALAVWRDRGRRGVVEAVTGTGKTRIGLAAAWEELEAGGHVEVLVPSIELLNQWSSWVQT